MVAFAATHVLIDSRAANLTSVTQNLAVQAVTAATLDSDQDVVRCVRALVAPPRAP
jgi:hypothetical protein